MAFSNLAHFTDYQLNAYFTVKYVFLYLGPLSYVHTEYWKQIFLNY